MTMQEESASETGNCWTTLPPDLIKYIGQFVLKDLKDYIRFRVGCKAWREASTDPRHIHPSNLPPQPPWLLLDYHTNSDQRSFYCLADRKVITLCLPETRDTFITGSVDGWLVHVKFPSQAISLYNPLTRAQYYVSSGEQEAGILSEDGQTALLRSQCPIFRPISCQPGGVVLACPNSWKIGYRLPEIDCWLPYYLNDPFFLFSMYKGNLYGATIQGKIYMFDKCSAKATQIAQLPAHQNLPSKGKMVHLAESQGKLLAIISFRRFQPDENQARKFIVYELKFDNQKVECIATKSLGGEALFLGLDRTLSVSAKEYPGIIQANCIYFIDISFRSDSCGHYGLFNLDDETESLQYIPAINKLHPGFQLHFWFTPNLCNAPL